MKKTEITLFSAPAHGMVVLGFAMLAAVLSVAGGIYALQLSQQNTKTLITRILETQEKRDYVNALNTLAIEITDLLQGINGASVGVYQSTVNNGILNNPRYQCRSTNPVAHTVSVNGLSFMLICQTVGNAAGVFPDPVLFILEALESPPAGVAIGKHVEKVFFRNESRPVAGPPPPGIPNHLVFTVQPSNASVGQNITPSVVVEVRDASENRVSVNIPITLAIEGSPAGVILQGSSVNAVSGVATFSNLTINSVGLYKLVASSPSQTSGTSNQFNATGPCEMYLLSLYPSCGFVLICSPPLACHSKNFFFTSRGCMSGEESIRDNFISQCQKTGGTLSGPGNTLKCNNSKACEIMCQASTPCPVITPSAPRCQPFPQCLRRF